MVVDGEATVSTKEVAGVEAVGLSESVDTVSDRVSVTSSTTLESDAVACAAPFSNWSRSSTSPLKFGMKRVHQKAMRRPRSTMRCLRMKRTTRTKKTRPARTNGYRFLIRSDHTAQTKRVAAESVVCQCRLTRRAGLVNALAKT